MQQSLKPVEAPFDTEVAQILARYPQRDGYLLSLFRVFANSVRFLRKGVADLLDRDSPLAMRLREIVILRVTANRGCEYEWGVHVAAFSAHVGFSETQIRATCDPVLRATCWSRRELRLLRVVDELCRTGTLDDAALTAFQLDFDIAEQLEVLALVGNYHTVCFVANLARLDPEPFAARFPD